MKVLRNVLKKTVGRFLFFSKIVFVGLISKKKKESHFIIIGTPKSGSSSLYEYLREHPQIKLSKIKEHNFFMSIGHDWFRKKKIKIFLKTIILNTCASPPLNRIIRYLYFNQCEAENGFVSGDASINYFYFDNGVVAKRIKKYVPNAKLILLLRNPVERIQSNFWMNYKQAKKNKDWNFAYDSFEDYVKDKKYIQPINDYVKYLKIWLKYFKKEQILIIKSIDFFENTQTVVDEICKFLNIKKIICPNQYWITPHSSSPKDYPEMSKISYDTLKSYFANQEIELEKITGIHFNWF